MLHQLGWAALAAIVALGLFLAMLVCLEIGRRIGVQRLNLPGARVGVGVVDGTVYALLALLLGFSFNGAAARFDARRALVGEENNAASTAWLRIDMLPKDQQPAVRASMRAYIDALINSYTAPTREDMIHPPEALTRATSALWMQSVAAVNAPGGEQARMLLLPSVNELFDAVDKERFARTIHPPLIIYAMLALSALAGALFVGYAIANAERRNWLYMIGVAATIASAVYVIVELEYPRLGIVRVDGADRSLLDVRSTMN
jgi:hypothetical protein